MALFEKINNHTLRQVLLAAGNPAPITRLERGWLKRVLAASAADDLLSAELRNKLQVLLKREDPFPDTSGFVEKGNLALEYSPAGPLLGTLSTAIRDGFAVTLDYAKHEGSEYKKAQAIPCRQEYSLARREWYLLWLHGHARSVSLQTTALRNIRDVRIMEKCPDWEERQQQFRDCLTESEREVTLLAEECYPGALLSVLNAFSCFDATVSATKRKQELRLRVRYLADEQGYVLQKIRFLGRRVTVERPDELRERMRETARRAMERYESRL
jgi:predicted DNA-binding transcriptional regulator YafY